MPTYRIKQGFTHGVNNQRYPDTVELAEEEAVGFLDKLELVEEVPAAVFDVSGATIASVLDAVTNGDISAEDALTQELAGKNRTTLITQLEALINGADK